MKIFLVRHTESEGNQIKVYAGKTDFPLTDNGKRQIADVITKLSTMIVPTQKYSLYSSPLQRCTNLADKIERLLRTTKTIDDRLCEINFGVFEHKTYKEIETEYPDLVKEWNQNHIHFQIPKGESLKMCFDRVQLFCEGLIQKNADAVIVSHGGIIKLILLALLHLDIEHFWKFYTSNGCIIELEFNDGFGFLKNIIQLS